MVSKILKGIIPALTAALAIKVSAYLQSLKISPLEAISLAAIVAACLAVVCDTLIQSAKKSSFHLRKLLDKRARFEGDWIVETAPGSRMPYGMVSIDYNADTDDYTYSGAAYDNNGQLGSEWSCDHLQFDIPNGKARFVCSVTIKGDGGAYHEAYGWLSFKKTHLRKGTSYARGDGFFTVIGNSDLKGEFSLDRLDRSFVQKILCKDWSFFKKILFSRYISTRDDMAKVVAAYHSQKSEKLEP